MKKTFLYSGLVLFAMTASASAKASNRQLSEANDTLVLSQATLDQSIALRKPFLLDTINLRGEAFNPSEVFTKNEALVHRSPSKLAHLIKTGAALDSAALHVLRFTVDVKRFYTALQLKAPKLSYYQLYVNGRMVDGQNIALQPGRSKLTLLCYSHEQARDTFEVSLIGKDAKQLRLNATDARLYDLNDMTQGENYTGFKMSPSGRYLVTYYCNTMSNGQAEYRTVLTDLETKRTLLNTNGYINYEWMPRRDVFYFSRKVEGGTNLYSLDPATMKEVLVVERIPNGHFTISPNEKFLIFHVQEEGPTTDGSLRQLMHPEDRDGSWRSRTALFYYDLTTGTQQRLTYGRENVSLEDITADGKRLLLSRSTMEVDRQPFLRMDCFEMNTDTWVVDTVFVAQPWINDLKYSPKGDQLLVTATPAAFEGIGSEVKAGQHPQGYDYRLFLYDLRSKQAKPLLKNFLPSVKRARWNAADGMVYFTCNDGCDVTLWRLNPYNADRFRFELPVTALEHFSFSKTKYPRFVFSGQTGETARNAYLTQLTSARPKVEAFGEVSFAKLYPNVRVPSCHEWSFKSTRGDVVKGFYQLPADFDATKKYPMIVYYYGGVAPSQRALEFHYPLSVLANMGYVVLTLNPSGAVGSGQEWAARHSNAWGEVTADEIIEGTKTFCQQNSYVNDKKIGCMGASYGGFMTQFLQTRTDIFAAAISHAGISNIASYWGAGRWGYTYSESAAYGSFPWNKPELYTRQSPLFNADKIHTPLLLLHGTVDTNVPTTESQQLYTALKILGREVSYITVDGENHFVADFNKRRQWQETIMAWFAKYLQNDDTWWTTMGYK